MHTQNRRFYQNASSNWKVLSSLCFHGNKLQALPFRSQHLNSQNLQSSDSINCFWVVTTGKFILSTNTNKAATPFLPGKIKHSGHTIKNYWDFFFPEHLQLREPQRQAAIEPFHFLRQQHATRMLVRPVSLKTHSWKLSAIHFDYTTWWQSRVKSLTSLACIILNKWVLARTQPTREQEKSKSITLEGSSVTCLRFTKAHKDADFYFRHHFLN